MGCVHIQRNSGHLFIDCKENPIQMLKVGLVLQTDCLGRSASN